MVVLEEVVDNSAAEQFKQEGNDAFKKGELLEAVRLFSSGIDSGCDDEFKAVLLTNRSMARYKMGDFFDSLHDAIASFDIKDTKKSCWRACQAAVEMEDYEACDLWGKRLAKHDVPMSQKFAEMVSAKHAQVVSADYDFGALLKGDVNIKDLEEFVGAVELRADGLYATADFEVGNLVVVSKPFVIGEKAKLLEIAMRKLKNCSQKERDAFYGLGSAPEGTLDAGQLRQAMSGFAGQTAGKAHAPEKDTVSAILKKTARANASGDLSEHEHDDPSSSTGVWILPSYLRHGCFPNVQDTNVSGVSFIRATRKIKAGDQLFTSWVSPFQTRTERLQNLQAGFSVDGGDDLRNVLETALPADEVHVLSRDVDDVIQSLDPESLQPAVEKFQSTLTKAEAICHAAAENLNEEQQAAANKMGLDKNDLFHLFAASFTNAYTGLAMAFADLDQVVHAIAIYGKMCAICEVVAPFSPYHVQWSVDRAGLQRAYNVHHRESNPQPAIYAYMVHHHARGGGIDVFKEQQLSLYCEISDYNDMNESFVLPTGIYGEADGVPSCRDVPVPEDLLTSSASPSPAPNAGDQTPARGSPSSRASDTTMNSPGTTVPPLDETILDPDDVVEFIKWQRKESEGIIVGHFETESTEGKVVDIANDGSCLSITCLSGHVCKFELPAEVDPSSVPNSISFSKAKKLMKVKLPVLG